MTDLTLMLEAWNHWLATGSTASRDIALSMAEDNRKRAQRTQGSGK